MPIYEYQCSSCHHHFDLMQKIYEAAVTQCPKCGKFTVNKLVSAAGFQLKGTGWYATDFKSKPKETAEPTSSTKEAKETKVTSASPETKAKTVQGDAE